MSLELLKRKSGSVGHAQNLEERLTLVCSSDNIADFVIFCTGDKVFRTLALEVVFMRHCGMKLKA